MILAADYPFLDIVGTMLVFFFWVMWFWALIVVLTDVYSRTDLSGWSKAGWTLACIIIPLVGVLAYLIVHGHDMADRRVKDAERQRHMVDEHIRTVAHGENGGSGAAQIAQAKDLLDHGAIDAAEFEQLKRRALSAS